MAYKSGTLRAKAIGLRKRGKSLRDIEQILQIPRSTLSGWLREVELTTRQQEILKNRHSRALIKARFMAAQRHINNKRERIKKIHSDIDATYGDLSDTEPRFLEIALAMLYLGEGSKRDKELGLGNSDPKIMRFYVSALHKLYNVSPSKLRAELHLRDDQDENALKIYWSKNTGIPLHRFRYVLKDKRTIGKPTYPGYMGVCYVGGGGLEIQRRLMYLSTILCKGV